MKVATDQGVKHIRSLQEINTILDAAKPNDVYFEVIEISPGQFYIPQLPPGMGITPKGKIYRNQGIGVYPKGTLEFVSLTMEAALGGGGDITLGNVAGFMLTGTDNQVIIKYMHISHNDVGNNRILNMNYIGINGIPVAICDDTLTIAPTVTSPLYPRIRDSAGAYHPCGAAPFGPLVLDATAYLEVLLTDLANTFDIVVNVAYTTIVHE